MGADLFASGLGAVLATAMGVRIAPLLRGRFRLAVLLPLLAPTLWIGYTYGHIFPIAALPPRFHAPAYLGLHVLRFAPLAALLVFLLPARLEASARFLRRGLRPSLRLLALGPVGDFLLVALLLFFPFHTEFETAALVNVERWTVKLFDAHAGGLSLAESLRRLAPALPPTLFALAGIGLLHGTRRRAPPLERPLPPAGPLAFALLAPCLLAHALLPGLVLFRDLSLGGAAMDLRRMGPDLLRGLLLSLAATACLLASARRLRGPALALLLPFPLLGPLIGGLVLLALFQTPGFSALAHTRAPLFLALLATFALPAWLLHRLLGQSLSALADALRQGADGERDAIGLLSWRFRDRPLWAVGSLLLFALSMELTLGALLAPAGETPIAARLYNLMHYGHAESLSRMVLLATAAPLLACAAAGLLLRAGARHVR